MGQTSWGPVRAPGPSYYPVGETGPGEEGLQGLSWVLRVVLGARPAGFGEWGPGGESPSWGRGRGSVVSSCPHRSGLLTTECSPAPAPARAYYEFGSTPRCQVGAHPISWLPLVPSSMLTQQTGSRALFLVCSPSPAAFPPLSDGCSLLGPFWEWDPTWRVLCPSIIHCFPCEGRSRSWGARGPRAEPPKPRDIGVWARDPGILVGVTDLGNPGFPRRPG